MKLSLIAVPVAALAFSALAAQPALAQAFKAGLWEANNKVGAGNAKLQEAMAMMQQQMAGMAPERRKQMEDMMARQGVSIGSDGVVVKMCITPEMAAQQQLPIQQQGNCTYQRSPMIGNTLKFSFTCSNPQGSGDGSVTFASPTAYTSSMRVTTSATGSPEAVDVQSTGRWLGSDCGSVKPLPLPSAK
jgi:Protein of unknown function (DUF3617)